MPKIVNSNGTMRARLISPGQGSSGYYSPALLEKSVSKFTDAQVYWDHPTSTEEATRPERSLRDLAGKIVGTPTWESAGKEGPGIYADVQVFKPYQEAVNELGPHIGMSIRASGTGAQGNVGGKKTVVVESLDEVHSVDFVTLAGRGGKPLQMFEAARIAARAAKDGEMTLEETQKAIKDGIEAATAPLRERALKGDAATETTRILEGLSLHADTKARIMERVLESALPLKEGALDLEKLRESVAAIAKKEGEYASKLSGAGRVFGMGAVPIVETTPPKPEDIEKRRVEVFRRLRPDLSEAAAKVAVRGRVA